MNRIINPTTGRWVNRNGSIGQLLVRSKNIVTNKKRYLEVVKLWDWWSQRSPQERQYVSEIWWDTRLNDPIYKEYPFYLMDYEKSLKKAYSIIH